MTYPRSDLLQFQMRDRWPCGGRVRVSVVAPVYDEELNLVRLYEAVVAAMEGLGEWELILVDDGSLDGSAGVIREICAGDSRVKAVFFTENCGQTGAIAAGVQMASGDLVATIDADLQNDPADLPGMIELLEKGGHDAVVGWRRRRCDHFVRRASSKIANVVRNRISEDSIRDTGCSLRVFRREAIQALPLFNGMHRFLPTLLRYHGYSVAEMPVNHHPRTAGVSKYGVRNRAFKATLDLFAVRWMKRRRLLLPVGEVLGERGRSD